MEGFNPEQTELWEKQLNAYERGDDAPFETLDKKQQSFE